MVESNRPINSTNNNQTWSGAVSGGAWGAGAAGMTMGAAYGKHKLNEFGRDRVRNMAVGFARRNPMNALKTDDQILKEVHIEGNRFSDEAAFAKRQANTFHNKMSGGWKRAGIVAGMTALGAGIGAAAD